MSKKISNNKVNKLSNVDKKLKNINKTLNKKITLDKKVSVIKSDKKALTDDDLIYEHVNNNVKTDRLKIDSIPKQINPSDLIDDQEVAIDLSIYTQLDEEPISLNKELLDEDYSVDQVPLKERWKLSSQITSSQYNDKNQFLFAKRIDLIKEIDKLNKKKKLSKFESRELSHLKSQLDVVTSDLIFFNLGLVNNYSRKFSSSSDDGSDFEAAGVVGLMRAVTTYDPSRGTKFSTWAYKPIQREILKAVRDADFKQLNPGDFERRPEILRAVKTLQDGNEDFTPPYEDIAKLANTTVEAVKRVLNAPVIDSLHATISEDNDTSLHDIIEDVNAGVEDAAMSRQDIRDLESFGLSCLDERELFVIGRRFGLDGEPAQRLSAIGNILGLSREAVRQVEAKALSKLLHPVTRRKLARHGRK